MRNFRLLLGLVALPAFAATRFFFPLDTASPITPNPAFGSGWTSSSSGVRRAMVLTKGSSAITTGQTISLSGTANDKNADRQYVSDPLAGAQTISGTVKGQLMVREFATTDNVDQISILLRVVSNDGTSVTCSAVLALGNYAVAGEFINNATLRNKKIADGDTITSCNANDGDRIVLEIGFSNTTSGTTPQAAAKWGENATELPEDETQTTDGAGWFEFSATLTFQGPTGPPIGTLQMMGLGR